MGAGFYGIMAAIEAAQSCAVEEVIIFEASDTILSAAGKYNQARLHQGFHYPRSRETILQSKEGYEYYRRQFPTVAKDIKSNVYVTRDDGEVTSSEYLRAMDSCNLKYRHIDISRSPFGYLSQDVGYQAIEVDEGYIDISVLSALLKKQLRTLGVQVRFNLEVVDIDSENGKITTSSGDNLIFDLVVNCSYTNPFLGFEAPLLPIKYELCVMLLISSELAKGHAITIMDGKFVSVYPWLSNLHSVSSVSQTPIIKSESLADIRSLSLTLPQSQLSKAVKNIEAHMRELLDFDYVLVSHFTAVKVKIRDDHDDQRVVKTFINGKCLIVLQGKLDAVPYFLRELKQCLSGHI